MDEREKIGHLTSKDKLEQYLIKGQGISEFKKGEKSMFLGEFRERILKALTIPQLHEDGTYKEIENAIRDPRAKKLVINRKADLKKAAEYIRMAREYNVSFTTINDPDNKSKLGLVVASDDAVDIENIYIIDRRQKLRELGFSEEFINNPGKKVCNKCFEKIKKLAPDEVENYRLITFFDKLIGVKCIEC